MAQVSMHRLNRHFSRNPHEAFPEQERKSTPTVGLHFKECASLGHISLELRSRWYPSPTLLFCVAQRFLSRHGDARGPLTCRLDG